MSFKILGIIIVVFLIHQADAFGGSAIDDFNLGAKQYRAEDFSAADESFIKALTSEDISVEAKANYNIGNTKSRKAQLKEDSDLSGAIKLYESAIQYYRRAIELDEKDPDAKFNYEFIKKRVEELKQQQKQEKQQQSQKDQEQQKNKPQENQQQDKQQQEQPEQAQPQPESGRQEDNQEREEASDPVQEDEMSKEQARFLLEGHRQQEEARDKDKRKRTPVYPHILKDW